MTNTEFSDSFDVLLNSYNTKAEFGDQASKREIVLDEYEKSVLLTQAQDIIVKSYFDRNLNSEGQGFDDGTKRQVDFSSLIKVEDLTALPRNENTVTVTRGAAEDSTAYAAYPGVPGTWTFTNLLTDRLLAIELVFSDDDSQVTTTTFPSNGACYMRINCSTRDLSRVRFDGSTPTIKNYINSIQNLQALYFDIATPVKDIVKIEYIPDSHITGFSSYFSDFISVELPFKTYSGQAFDERGVIYTLPYKEVNGEAISKVLFILNEKLIVDGKNYVIVPINYQEYDREMSKPYGQPLKRQAWRLIQNVSTGFDIHSELIPKWNVDVSDAIYRIRYVKRPRPIVLEDFENLDIDGVSTATSCELNPILHNEILQKAFELAVQTRGGGSAVQPERQERRG